VEVDPINDERREQASSLLSKAAAMTNDAKLAKLNDAKPKLVFFGHQIVSGSNYFLVFENAEKGNFACMKVFEGLDNSIEFKFLEYGSNYARETGKCTSDRVIF